jgi:hypothetical protein
LSQIAAAHTADTNAGNIELFARWRVRPTAKHMPGYNYKRWGSRCSLEKFTSSDLSFDIIYMCHEQVPSIFFFVYINKFVLIVQGFRQAEILNSKLGFGSIFKNDSMVRWAMMFRVLQKILLEG